MRQTEKRELSRVDIFPTYSKFDTRSEHWEREVKNEVTTLISCS